MSKIHEWPGELYRLDRHQGTTLLTPDIASLAELMQTYKVPGIAIAAGDLGGKDDDRVAERPGAESDGQFRCWVVVWQLGPMLPPC